MIPVEWDFFYEKEDSYEENNFDDVDDGNDGRVARRRDLSALLCNGPTGGRRGDVDMSPNVGLHASPHPAEGSGDLVGVRRFDRRADNAGIQPVYIFHLLMERGKDNERTEI